MTGLGALITGGVGGGTMLHVKVLGGLAEPAALKAVQVSCTVPAGPGVKLRAGLLSGVVRAPPWMDQTRVQSNCSGVEAAYPAWLEVTKKGAAMTGVRGGGMMVLDATPGSLRSPTMLVTLQEICTVPELLGVKVTLGVFWPLVMLPPEMDQA